MGISDARGRLKSKYFGWNPNFCVKSPKSREIPILGKTTSAAPLVWLDIVKNEILQESQKTNSAWNWPISPFFSMHPIFLCSKVLIPSSNLWRASPTPFRASKKVKNWQNITFSWTGECPHTQLLCLYGDNLMCKPYKSKNLDFFRRLQNIHFCGLVLTFYSGTFGNIFWPDGVDSF